MRATILLTEATNERWFYVNSRDLVIFVATIYFALETFFTRSLHFHRFEQAWYVLNVKPWNIGPLSAQLCLVCQPYWQGAFGWYLNHRVDHADFLGRQCGQACGQFFFFSFSTRLNSIYIFYHIITQLTDEKLGPNSGFYHLHTWADIRVCFITMY